MLIRPRPVAVDPFRQRLEQVRANAGLCTLDQRKEIVKAQAQRTVDTFEPAPKSSAPADYSAVKLTLPSSPTDPEFVPSDGAKGADPRGDEVVAGMPPGGGLIHWHEQIVNDMIEYGTRTGAVDDAIASDSHQLAKNLLGDQEQRQISVEELAQTLATRIPGERLAAMHPEQLAGAVQYINDSPYGSQAQRIEKAIQTYQTMDKAGTPPVSRQWLADMIYKDQVPGHSLEKFSTGELAQKYAEVQSARYTPGDHSFDLGSSRELKFEVGSEGQMLKSEVEHHGFWSKVGGFLKKIAPIALGIAGFALGGVGAIIAKVASSAISTVTAIKNKNWLGVIAGIAGGIAGGLSGAASGAAQTTARVFDGISRGASAVGGAINAVKYGSIGGLIGAAANGLASASSFVGDGLHGLSGTLSKWSDRLSVGASFGSAVDAARHGDWLGAAQAGLDLLRCPPPGNFERGLSLASNSLRLARAVQSNDWSSAIGSAMDTVQGLTRTGRIAEADSVKQRAWELSRAVLAGDLEGAAVAGAGLRTAVGVAIADQRLRDELKRREAVAVEKALAGVPDGDLLSGSAAMLKVVQSQLDRPIDGAFDDLSGRRGLLHDLRSELNRSQQDLRDAQALVAAAKTPEDKKSALVELDRQRAHVMGEIRRAQQNLGMGDGFVPLPFDSDHAYVDRSADPLFTDNRGEIVQKGSGGVSEWDVAQGYQLGDCYLQANLSSIAKVSPKTISDAITPNPDGSYTVRLYKRHVTSRGSWMEPVDVPVDPKELPDATAYYGHGPDSRELWVTVVEKAYATMNGGYDGMSHGDAPANALEALTGRQATTRWIDAKKNNDALFDFIRKSAASRPMTASTNSKTAAALVSGHAYSLFGAWVEGGKRWVYVRNPWANNGQGGAQKVSWDDFVKNFGSLAY